jgi:D-alanyl-D-alanine carboxypeptidase (penicillin-binding protein 5/6)
VKCIVKKSLGAILALTLAVGAAGCGENIELEESYDLYQTTKQFDIQVEKKENDDAKKEEKEPVSFFGEQLCVGGNENTTDEGVTQTLSYAAGLFDLSGHEIPYARNIHERVYPASTTKILTAYVALKYGDLNATATVSENALILEEGSTVSGLSPGDQITLEQLLYGLILCSGNDAANVIAEMISGNTEEFAKLMNQEARALGATNSNFTNAHGLPDEQHYTSVYDLYLIFQAALKEENFRKLIETKEYTAEFTNSQGETVTRQWETTNLYLKGEKEIPEGIHVVGGKTGTTNDAGNCLVLYSENTSSKPYISIVMKANSKDELYQQMTELLKKIWN